jgi:hypothetical protein
MPIFKAPQYSKSLNPYTGKHEQMYTFNIEYSESDSGLSYVAQNDNEITLNGLQKVVLENLNWWNDFIKKFLDSSSAFFSKPYTVEHINKITKHTINGDKTCKFPANVTFMPKNIQISGGLFMINWSYKTESIIIDIPDLLDLETLNNSLPDSKTSKSELDMEELNIDELPVDKNTTEPPLEIDSPAKYYDRQRVKESRLKAKLAVFKAQRQMAEYYQKYGQNISDSDTEYTTSEDESEDEDVQL